MAIFTSKMSFRRYVLAGDRALSMAEIEEGLNRWCFSERTEIGGKREGWVLQDNMLDDDFSDDLNRWSVSGDWAWFCYRRDQRTPPPQLMKATLDQRVRAWCRENEQARCPRVVRSELKELVEAELVARALPKATLGEVAWNLRTGVLCFGKPTGTMNEGFRELFQRTFGLMPVVWNPLLALPPERVHAYLDSERSRTFGGMFDGEVQIREEDAPTWSASVVNLTRPIMDDVQRFLLWLAWCGRSGRVVGGLTINMDDKLVLQQSGSDGSGVASMTGPDVVGFPGLQNAIIGGANPTELRVYVGQDGNEEDSGWLIGLRGDLLDTVRTGLLSTISLEGEDASHERLLLLDEAMNQTDRLFRAWVDDLFSPSWPETERAMRAFTDDDSDDDSDVD